MPSGQQYTPVDASERRFQAVPAEHVEKVLLRTVHLSWAYRGAVWILWKIDDNGRTVCLKTPRGKMRSARIDELRLTRKTERWILNRGQHWWELDEKTKARLAEKQAKKAARFSK